MGRGSRSETKVAAHRPGRSDRQACRAVAGPATRFRGGAPFVAFADLGASVGSHRPERRWHRRDGPRPWPADSRWRGRTGFRRRGAARCRLGAAGPRALNSWSRQVRHAQPGWLPQLPELSAPVRPRRLIAARKSARHGAQETEPAPPGGPDQIEIVAEQLPADLKGQAGLAGLPRPEQRHSSKKLNLPVKRRGLQPLTPGAMPLQFRHGVSDGQQQRRAGARRVSREEQSDRRTPRNLRRPVRETAEGRSVDRGQGDRGQGGAERCYPCRSQAAASQA
jgi:hypothetical protein